MEEHAFMNQELSALKTARVLVVGTTSDYIDWIRKACPNRALFLTDPGIRRLAEEAGPGPEEEILTLLDDPVRIRAEIDRHLEKWGLTLTGVACFDCESMELAAALAPGMGLDYPDIRAIRNCRDKFVCKQIWQEHHIPCPGSVPVDSVADVLDFLSQTRTGLVLKPMFGSGSELVFRCTTKKGCEQAFKIIKAGLSQRSSTPLFKDNALCGHLMLAEEMIEGPEFSCDFMVEDGTVTLIRMTRKIKPVNRPFGTILGYVIPAALPPRVDGPEFERMLLKSAAVLGIHRGICMVDLIFRDNEPVLIEMTPRPGGDCLPSLLLEAGDLDILKLALDFAEKKPVCVNGPACFRPHIGVRIHAHKSGRLQRLSTQSLGDEVRVKKTRFIRKPGHIITMPPEDYDSWLLGHMIIQTNGTKYPETQCLLITKRLVVEIEDRV
jgi:biotin carboxylase